MDPTLLASLLNLLGTQGIPLILKIKSDIDTKRNATTVTNEDLIELARLSGQSSADIYKRLGIEPPPTVA